MKIRITLDRLHRLALYKHELKDNEVIKMCRKDIKLLIELIDKATPKATPKRPRLHCKTIKFDRVLGLQDVYVCPNCGNACLVRYASNARNENNNCPNCGQALDWSKE